jgi:hypothetical protein
MTKIVISFPRELTLAAIDGVERYYETVESQLQSAKAAERDQIYKTVRGLGLEGEEELGEWHLAMQEHEMNFDMLLPNFLRYSCVVLLYLIVENKLGELCKAADSPRKNPPPPPPRQRVIRTYEKYLSQNMGIAGLQWEHLYELSKVRNCIVHASGNVEASNDRDYLRQLAEKGIGISISGQNEDFQDSLKPLYMDEHMLMLKPEYCKRIIKNVHAFFEELCDALSLPHLEIKTGKDA